MTCAVCFCTTAAICDHCQSSHALLMERRWCSVVKTWVTPDIIRSMPWINTQPRNSQPFPFRSVTLRTEFNPPNGLATVSLARGSGIHSPSTTNRYSYVPGGKAKALIQRPAPSEIMGAAPGRQSLKVPATEIAAAVGWLYSSVVIAIGRVNSGRAGRAPRPL